MTTAQVERGACAQELDQSLIPNTLLQRLRLITATLVRTARFFRALIQTMSMSILIADDHPLFRAALRQAVKAAFADATLHEVDSLAALERIGEQNMDLHMPGTHGFSGLIYLRGRYPRTPVAVISANEAIDVIHRAIHFGATGFVPKSASLDVMTHALQNIARGEQWLPEHARRAMPRDLPDHSAMQERVRSLTPQQFRVMGMLLAGMQNKLIAYELDVSEATIKAHMTAIFRKLGVRNRTQAVLALKDLAIDPPALD